MLSDRALVFLLAVLDVWNGETMHDFLNRSYRIVTNNASEADLMCTNVHACLAHIMLVSNCSCLLEFLYVFVVEYYRIHVKKL